MVAYKNFFVLIDYNREREAHLLKYMVSYSYTFP